MELGKHPAGQPGRIPKGAKVKEYELTVLIHPDLETDLDAPLTKVREIVTNAGGTITREDNWGKKKLAYPISRVEFGVYVYMDVELPAEAPLKISNILNITDEVLRYLLVKVDPKARAALAEQAKKAEASEETKEEA
jgi:small subunit ribosomal protein S6